MHDTRPRSRPSSCNLIVMVCECREGDVSIGEQRSFQSKDDARTSPLDFNFTCTSSHHAGDHTSPLSQTMAPVQFWSTPLTYLHWAARRKPAIFWSFIVGGMGPITVVCTAIGIPALPGIHEYHDGAQDSILTVLKLTVPSIREYFGDGPRRAIPLTYPSEWLSRLGSPRPAY